MAPSILTEESLWYVCHPTTAAQVGKGLGLRRIIVVVWALNRSRLPIVGVMANVFLD